MEFKSHINGEACRIKVTYYQPEDLGSRWEPPSSAELEFDVLDMEREPSLRLQSLITDDDETRILKQFEALLEAAKLDMEIAA